MHWSDQVSVFARAWLGGPDTDSLILTGVCAGPPLDAPQDLATGRNSCHRGSAAGGGGGGSSPGGGYDGGQGLRAAGGEAGAGVVVGGVEGT